MPIDPTALQTAITTIGIDTGLLHDIVHGTLAESVVTEGGTVPSIAKKISDIGAAILAGFEGGFIQVAADATERDAATPAQVGQFLFQLDTKALYYGYNTIAGAWFSFQLVGTITAAGGYIADWEITGSGPTGFLRLHASNGDFVGKLAEFKVAGVEVASIRQDGVLLLSNPAGQRAVLQLPGAQIVVYHADNTFTEYPSGLDTDVARGTALTDAFAAMVAGDHIVVKPGNYLVHKMANPLTSGCVYEGKGAYVYIDDTSTSMLGAPYDKYLFYKATGDAGAFSVDGFYFDGGSIVGAFETIVVGSGSNRWISNCSFSGWNGGAIRNSEGISFYNGNLLSNLNIFSCGIGLSLGGEYWQGTNVVIKGCTTALIASTASQRFSNLVIRDCSYGVSLVHGASDGRCTFVGGSITGCTFPVQVESDVAAASSFVGIDAVDGTINIGGAGIEWIGGQVSCEIQATLGTPSGTSYFLGTRFPDALASTYLDTLSTAARAKIKLVSCFGAILNEESNDYESPIRGTGTPEGNVTATVGRMYTRIDGGAGTTLYVKETGTGNTGWVAK